MNHNPLASLIKRITVAGLVLADFSTFYMLAAVAFGG